MEQRVSLITLGARDAVRLAAFYDALGWTRVETDDGVVAYDLIGQTLGLYPLEMLANDIGVPAENLGRGAMTIGCNVRAKEDVAQVLDRVGPAGGTVLKPAEDVFWGGIMVILRIPKVTFGKWLGIRFPNLARTVNSNGTGMRKPASMWSLETLGRVRLSKYFYMREFLYSEIANFHQLQNIPESPDLAIENGRNFCISLLDPLEDTFGRVAVRSGYRSPSLNTFGNQNKLNCARNDYPQECHIWDWGTGDKAVAGASIVIPWFTDQYESGRDWRDLAWWIHDHLPYSEMWFFPKLCAFNISWRPTPWKVISSYVAPRGTLLRRGDEPGEDLLTRQARYEDFPRLIHRPVSK